MDTLKQNAHAIEVSSISPMVGETFYRIYHSGPLVVYQSQYFYNYTNHKLLLNEDESELSVETDSLFSELRYKYTVFHKDSAFGYDFYADKNEDGRRVRIDSVLKNITGTNQFDSFLTLKPDSVIWDKRKTALREVFIFPAQKGCPAISVQLFYSKNMNDLPFSINARVDNAKKMKFYKIEIDFDAFYSDQQQLQWPAMKDKTEVKWVAVENVEDVNWYLNRYRQMATL